MWVEDPGYQGARGALAAAGATLVPVPVDEEGLDVTAGILGWTPPGMTDRWAATQGMETPPLSAYRLTPGGRAGLLLGYTSFDAPALRRGVDRLAQALATRGSRDGEAT